MADLETLRRRICEHPAFQGGPADEDYWLDFLEFTLAKYGTYDFMVERRADWCERQPEMLYAYIITSNSPLKKASLTGFHATAKHIAAKAVSPSSETMRTI